MSLPRKTAQEVLVEPRLGRKEEQNLARRTMGLSVESDGWIGNGTTRYRVTTNLGPDTAHPGGDAPSCLLALLLSSL